MGLRGGVCSTQCQSSLFLLFSHLCSLLENNWWFRLYRHIKILYIKQPDEGSLEDIGSLFKGPQVKKVGCFPKCFPLFTVTSWQLLTRKSPNRRSEPLLCIINIDHFRSSGFVAADLNRGKTTERIIRSQYSSVMWTICWKNKKISFNQRGLLSSPLVSPLPPSPISPSLPDSLRERLYWPVKPLMNS